MSLTIPIRGGFSAATGASPGRYRDFGPQEMYLLHEDREFRYRVPSTSTTLVANILSGELQRKARALSGGAERPPGESLSMRSPVCGALDRFGGGHGQRFLAMNVLARF